jgi:serine kinase of HPr protein (carbohydrate metabolism regulator)
MTSTLPETIHATTVAINGRGLLIRGRSGSGKSDLALRLIDRGGILVSDDYTVLIRQGPNLIASPPPSICGKIEVRHVGIVDVAYITDVPVCLIVDLDLPLERLPEPLKKISLLGVSIALIVLSALEPSAPIKAEMALARFGPETS